ncbi:hypothetical protein PUN28_005040 [Cardiocondyla obscurior]|uniref:Odorant receptor n=1 Tax=Cardiocondyla obscurior TaxID=286306 RepID=A0AAW2GFM8_9HYME
MPGLSVESWIKIRQERVSTFISKWQNCHYCPINRYYAVNRILLLCVGLWPNQKSSSRHIAVTFTTMTLVSGIVFQLTPFITHEYNVNILLQILAYTIPWIAYTLKYHFSCLKMRQFRDILERVRCDWNQLSNTHEIEIIKEYAAIGRFVTLIVTLFIYVSIFGFIIIMFLSNVLLDIMSSKNESCPRQFPILIECFIDQQKHYFLIFFQLTVIVVSGFTTVAASETLNMSFVQHACGLFEIAGHRIDQALHENKVQGVASTAKRNSMIYQGIISGFDMYKKAIEFVEMLKVICKWTYSALLPLGVISLSINLYRFSQLIASKEYFETVISFIFILGHFWYMFFTNYMGQQVINHSSDMFYRTYNVQWYVAPLKAQKLLLLIMQRGVRHCTLVIDGLFVSSFEGFATLASTSISYFAIICSVF